VQGFSLLLLEVQLKYALQLLFSASNNAAEYEALVHGPSIAVSLGIKKLMVYDDS
jgi:ribonuclease HI